MEEEESVGVNRRSLNFFTQNQSESGQVPNRGCVCDREEVNGRGEGGNLVLKDEK